MGNAAIEVKNVTKTFGDADVLRDVSVTWEKGKIHGLIGRNGSGKTMLMKCICGFVPVTKGAITVLDQAIGKNQKIPGDLGIIIETPGFLPNYSAYHNLKFLADISGKADKARILDCIKAVGLDPKSKKRVGKYSLGMRQRLGLAQAIMENPALLILDEPMNGLDKDGVLEMRQYLLALKEEGKTILIASHSAEDIDVLCDTVHEMDKGKISQVR